MVRLTVRGVVGGVNLLQPDCKPWEFVKKYPSSIKYDYLIVITAPLSICLIFSIFPFHWTCLSLIYLVKNHSKIFVGHNLFHTIYNHILRLNIPIKIITNSWPYEGGINPYGCMTVKYKSFFFEKWPWCRCCSTKVCQSPPASLAPEKTNIYPNHPTSHVNNAPWDGCCSVS